MKFIFLAFIPVCARCLASIIVGIETTKKEYMFIFLISLILAIFYCSVLDATPTGNKYFDKKFTLTYKQRKQYEAKRDDQRYYAEWQTILDIFADAGRSAVIITIIE